MTVVPLASWHHGAPSSLQATWAHGTAQGGGWLPTIRGGELAVLQSLCPSRQRLLIERGLNAYTVSLPPSPPRDGSFVWALGPDVFLPNRWKIVDERWRASKVDIAECTLFLDVSGFNTNTPQIARFGFCHRRGGPW